MKYAKMNKLKGYEDRLQMEDPRTSRVVAGKCGTGNKEKDIYRTKVWLKKEISKIRQAMERG